MFKYLFLGVCSKMIQLWNVHFWVNLHLNLNNKSYILIKRDLDIWHSWEKWCSMKNLTRSKPYNSAGLKFEHISAQLYS